MLKWDQQQVAFVLGAEPEFQDNSSYLYHFATPGGPATLTVFPLDGRVELEIGEGSWASWKLECSALQFNDEPPEDGGQCLVLCPHDDRNKNWIVISREDEVFNVLTVFNN